MCSFSTFLLYCSARKAKVDELQQKLEKLKQSASLVEQRMMFDRAVFWAAVKVQQDKRDKVKQTLEVRWCRQGARWCGEVWSGGQGLSVSVSVSVVLG